MEKYCESCLKEDRWRKGHEHHIVKRSQAPYMVHVPLNIKILCEEHHTGKLGVHHHPEVDLMYKQELQLKLKLMLEQDYYTFEEIKKLLKISDNTTKAIVKTLPKHKEGYRKNDLIMHMMGDRNYLEVEK